MKNVFKKGFLAAFLLAAITANAAKKVNVVVKTSEAKFSVHLEGIAKGETLVIKNFAGQSLYNKRFIKVDAFAKSFDLSSTTNGVYFVEVEDANLIQITPILKNDNGVSLLEKASRSFFKPQFLNSTDKFKVSLVNNTKTPIKLAIYASDGTQLISESDIKDVVIKRDYDTSKLPRGEYTMTVTNDKRTFAEDFKVL